ncbi:MAG: hypothetical protein IJD36_01075 [Clostridia bacterium]|nr:hypothetical protein [Clostridia bacterium]
MTHPDILKMERFGELNPSRKPRRIGECFYCGAPLFDNMTGIVRSVDGIFCDCDCCHENYEIYSL